MTSCPTCGVLLERLTPFCPACGAHLHGPSGLSTATSNSALAASRAEPGSTRFAPGHMIGDRYRMVGLIGRGGMGDVYRAEDLRFNEPVALKFLPEAVEKDPARLERLVAEVRNARRITHTNVCRVHDIGEVDGRRFVAMEYIDGEDLESLLRRIGRLPEEKATQIAREVCAGLAAIHEKGVLHRDLKPANVMLDGRGRARITDFGVAAAIEASLEGEIAGTPAYMSPEQLAGKPATVQSDLHALGLLLYELFTGDRARTRDTSTPDTRAKSAVTLDPAVQRAIAHCLEADPRRRPSSALALAAALPGSDPLAAALAAGQTPSPEIVAESGALGYLQLAVAIPLLMGLVASVALFAWAEGRRLYTAAVSFPYSPVVLAVKAQEMLGRLGYPELPADSAYGFESATNDYTTWMRQQPVSVAPWRHATSLRPPIVRFWYRASPKPMKSLAFFSGTAGGGMAVAPDDPPLNVGEMKYIELSSAGHLVNLIVALPAKDAFDAAASGHAFNWSQLFAEAGLDHSQFTSVTPEWLPLTMADARAAWIGPGADPTGSQLRVEAATHHGRPVFFRLVAPWTRPEQPSASTLSRVQQILTLFGNTLTVAIIAAATGLAVRNIRRGRADRRGATRLSIAIGAIVVSAAALGSHYTLTADDLSIIASIFSRAFFFGILVWIAYVALEPYVRRRRPEMLIGWSRMLEGRWRDALVGRALLIGALLGVARLLVVDFQELVLEQHIPRAATDAWTGFSAAAAVILGTLPTAAWVSLLLIVFLVLLHILLRSELIVAGVTLAVFTMLFSHHVEAPDDSMLFPVLAHLALAVFGFLVLLAARLGLLTLFVSYVVMYVGTELSVSWPHPPFLRPTVLLGLAAMLAPGLFGFYTSFERRVMGAKWLD